jgi:sugar phosphate isomerase/epimerase
MAICPGNLFPHNSSQRNRRRFLQQTVAAAAAGGTLLAGPALAEPPMQHNPLKNPIAVFAKHVQGLEFEELGRRLSSIDVQGIEATLRRGGQIEPEQLPDKLGWLCDALGQHDQRVIIAASNVNQVTAASEAYIGQLARFEIPYLRMEYYRYDFNRPILPQLDAFAKQAAELAALCESAGVTALYQNHAGRNYVGAALWDLLQVLSEIDRQYLACAMDIRHTTVELSQSYPAAYAAIRPHLGATYIKDFDWEEGKPVNVPLGQGRAIPLFNLIQQDGFVGPLSLHMEYIDHRDESLLEKCWDAIAADVATLYNWLQI